MEQKWIVYKYGQDTRCITDTDGNDVLSWMDVGVEQAEHNAKLCAAAPQMKELLSNILTEYNLWRQDGGDVVRHISNNIEKYEKLLKQLR